MPAPLYAYGGPNWIVMADGTTAEQAAAIGAKLVIDDELPPEGSYSILMAGVEDRGDLNPHRWFSTVPYGIEDEREALVGLALQRYADILDAGFPIDMSPYGGGLEHLQLRDANDKANWLTFKDACQDQIEGGGGDQPMPQAVQTLENNAYTVTANQGKAMMIALRQWGGFHLGKSQAVKRAARGAANQAVAAAVRALIEAWT
jgi:hypothetical protein